MSKPNHLESLLASKQDAAYAVLRIVSGSMFSVHGVQKLFGMLTDKARPAPFSQAWVGGIIELVAGIAIALGVFTRSAALLASGTMAVAYTQFHWKLQLGASFFPVVNKGELALLYSFVFLFIACAGSGAFSFDGRRR